MVPCAEALASRPPCSRRTFYPGLRALDLHRVCQIADRLDVSLDWLLGRTDVMDLAKGEDEAASLRPIPSGVGIAPWYMKGTKSDQA